MHPSTHISTPYKGLIGTCSQSGYGFRGFCLKQGMDFITLSQTGYLFLANVLNGVWFWEKCLKQGMENRTILSQTESGLEEPSRTSPPKDKYRVLPPQDQFKI